jgi:hypothetical protein
MVPHNIQDNHQKIVVNSRRENNTLEKFKYLYDLKFVIFLT